MDQERNFGVTCSRVLLGDEESQEGIPYSLFPAILRFLGVYTWVYM